jgi:hypothetical protein
MDKWSRRGILALMSAGVLAATGSFLLVDGTESLIRKILARRFPGVQMSQASLAALQRDLILARFRNFRRRTALQAGAWAADAVGIESLATWKMTAELFHHVERQVVTYFLLGSDFLEMSKKGRYFVTYTQAPEVCPNRFAEYDS